jgi:hypothetical protein
MPSLKNLFREVKDPNDYDGAVFVTIKDGRIANFGFTGDMPEGIDRKVFLYRTLMESCFALAFHQSDEPSSESRSSGD